MAISLYVVGERVMVIKREIKQVSEREFLVDVHVTMRILWGIKKHLIMHFGFAVSENREETRNSTSCKERVLEASVSAVTTQVLIDSGSVRHL